jgi:phosphopentomutase
VFITADHGGHDRTHGTEMPEDMTISMIAIGPDFAPGSSLDGANIKDIAPTVAKLLGVEPDEDWEGKSLL